MQILVTGGTGFIGKSLCNALLSQGHQLCILTRNPEQFAEPQNKIRAIDSLEQLGSEEFFDAIINLAGEGIADKRWSDQRKQLLLDSRLNTTQGLLDFISRSNQKPECLISASAVGFYGNQGDREVDEDTLPNPDFGQQLCQRWEDLTQRAEQQGVRVCRVRIGLVIGKEGGFLKRMLLPFKLGLGGPLGNGQQWMSWIHLEDLRQLIIWLMENQNCRGAYNAVSPHPITNKEFTKTLGACLNRPTLILAPTPLLKIALGEMSLLLLSGQRVLPKKAMEQGFNFQFSNLKDALNDVV